MLEFSSATVKTQASLELQEHLFERFNLKNSGIYSQPLFRLNINANQQLGSQQQATEGID